MYNTAVATVQALWKRLGKRQTSTSAEGTGGNSTIHTHVHTHMYTYINTITRGVLVFLSFYFAS